MTWPSSMRWLWPMRPPCIRARARSTRPSSSRWPRSTIPMLARNLLYTGVTRGKQLVVLIGQPKACALAVRNVRAMRRLTNLAARLRQQSTSG